MAKTNASVRVSILHNLSRALHSIVAVTRRRRRPRARPRDVELKPEEADLGVAPCRPPLPQQHPQRHHPSRQHRSGLLHADRKSSKDKGPAFRTAAGGMRGTPSRAFPGSPSNVAPVITPAPQFSTSQPGYDPQRHFRVSVSFPKTVWTALLEHIRQGAAGVAVQQHSSVVPVAFPLPHDDLPVEPIGTDGSLCMTVSSQSGSVRYLAKVKMFALVLARSIRLLSLCRYTWLRRTPRVRGQNSRGCGRTRHLVIGVPTLKRIGRLLSIRSALR